jgi:hypothetical protein
LYFRYSREDKLLFLTLFDAAGVEECYQRDESIVPFQALALTNDDFVWSQARRIARRLAGGRGRRKTTGQWPLAPAHSFVTAAFEQVLCRRPMPAELAACSRFLDEQAQRLADLARLTPFPGDAPATVPPAGEPHLRAREHLIHVLLSHNDFITIR